MGQGGEASTTSKELVTRSDTDPDTKRLKKLVASIKPSSSGEIGTRSRNPPLVHTLRMLTL